MSRPDRSVIAASLSRLKNWVEKENFSGYDPYDLLSSPYAHLLPGKWTKVLATQFHKRNPLQFRKLLGIPAQQNPKALGIFLHAYSLLQQKHKDQDYTPILDYLYQRLLETRSEGYHGNCWGYNFTWAGPEKQVNAYSPTSVATGFIARGLFEYYQLTGRTEIKDHILNISGFIEKDLHRIKSEDGVVFSYTSLHSDICYNASLLAAETLALIGYLEGNSRKIELAGESVRYVISRQHHDGRWNYSEDRNSGHQREQIDFHQGYVIDSIANIGKYRGQQSAEEMKAIESGMEFYRMNQFTQEGRSLWRWPSKYPCDIHHQAQGILSFSRHSYLQPDYASFSKKIAIWTIQNMQDPEEGYFYYRKYPFFTNRLAYMRWAQAWMLLALAQIDE